MVYDYLITLKKSPPRFIDMVSRLMYGFALLLFCYFFYLSSFSAYLYLVEIIAILIAWAVTVYKSKGSDQIYYRIGLLIAAAGWLLMPFRNIWMAVLYALAGLLERQVKFPSEIGFSKEAIRFNTLPKKVLPWSEINNVILKDGLLTIDRKNNHFFQKEVEGEVSATTEQEFNAFCRSCIESATN